MGLLSFPDFNSLNGKEQKIFEAHFDPVYSICIANELILGNQMPISVWANRILSVLLMQVAATDTELKTYSIRIIDLVKFSGIKRVSGQIYQYIQSASKELMKATIEVEDPKHPEKPWALLHWVRKIVYDGNGTLYCSLSEDICPYVLNLKARGYFTKYHAKEILPLNTYSAIRIYQYIAFARLGKKTCVKLTFDQLRYLCGLTEKDKDGNYIKYKRYCDLRSHVIIPSVKQINANSSSAYHISSSYWKNGSKPIGFMLLIKETNGAPKKKLPSDFGDSRKPSFDIDEYERESLYDTKM